MCKIFQEISEGCLPFKISVAGQVLGGHSRTQR